MIGYPLCILVSVEMCSLQIRNAVLCLFHTLYMKHANIQFLLFVSNHSDTKFKFTRLNMNVELPRQFLEQVVYFRDLHTEFEWHFYEPHFKIWDNVNELFITTSRFKNTIIYTAAQLYQSRWCNCVAVRTHGLIQQDVRVLGTNAQEVTSWLVLTGFVSNSSYTKPITLRQLLEDLHVGRNTKSIACERGSTYA